MPRAKKIIDTDINPQEIVRNKSVGQVKDCCDNCGQCENCLHPMGNIKNYTPLLTLLLIVSSFLLGMLLTKIGYLQENGGYPAQNTVGTGQTAGGPKPLHVAQAIGMDANKFKTCLETDKYSQQVAADLAYGQKIGVTGTPAYFINGLSIVGAQPYSVFQTTINQELATARANTVYDLFSQLSSALVPAKAYAQTGTVGNTAPTDTTTPTPAARIDVTTGPFPVLGDPNAKVTVIEFADFQCPFCKKAYTDVEANLIKDYVKTGKVKYAFQNYPFLGQESTVTAVGAYCANEQGKFWAYHNFLYEHQGQENSGQFTKANLE